ncbi:MAG: D-alanine--D-alanine ligase [Candidatus Hydrothermales bacterium]
MKIGIAFDLKPKEVPSFLPEDIFEEFDSEQTIESIGKALKNLGFEVFYLGSGKAFIEKILVNKPDFVFNIAEGFGTRSREGHIPSICEVFNIPYSGSDPLALNVTLDKELCKRFAKSLNIRTPYFKVIKSKKDVKNFKFNKFPCVLKLKNEGSSIGLRLSSKVNSLEELKDKALELFELYNEEILVEKFIAGKEITVGIIGNKRIKFLGFMEIRPKKLELPNFLYSLEIKRNFREEVEYIVPPEIPGETLKEIKRYVLKLFRYLNLRDFARFDFRLDEDLKPYFLEINPLPGLNPETSDFPIMVYKSGLTYDEIIKMILYSAFERYGIKKK